MGSSSVPSAAGLPVCGGGHVAAGEQIGERGGEEDRHRGWYRQRFVEEQLADGLGFDGAAAERDYGVIIVVGWVFRQRIEDAGGGFGFQAAEVLFPVTGKDLGDGKTVLRRDEGVDIDKGPVQARRQDAAHRRLARAHESGQDNTAGQQVAWRRCWPDGACAHFV